jgi:hypothetical protein
MPFIKSPVLGQYDLDPYIYSNETARRESAGGSIISVRDTTKNANSFVVSSNIYNVSISSVYTEGFGAVASRPISFFPPYSTQSVTVQRSGINANSFVVSSNLYNTLLSDVYRESAGAQLPPSGATRGYATETVTVSPQNLANTIWSNLKGLVQISVYQATSNSNVAIGNVVCQDAVNVAVSYITREEVDPNNREQIYVANRFPYVQQNVSSYFYRNKEYLDWLSTGQQTILALFNSSSIYTLINPITVADRFPYVQQNLSGHIYKTKEYLDQLGIIFGDPTNSSLYRTQQINTSNRSESLRAQPTDVNEYWS